MLNELILFSHLLVVILLVVCAGKIGKDVLGFLAFLFLLVSNLFVLKEIHVLGVDITTCDVYTIGCILSLNLIQEMCGKKESRRYLYMSISLLVVFLLFSRFQIYYLPTTHSISFDNAYTLLLKNSPRIVLSSLIVTFLSDRFDIWWFQFLREAFPNFGFSFRFVCSTLVSQVIDTVTFSFLGLYGLVENIWDCMLVAYIAKVLCILGSGAFFYFLPHSYFLTKKENISLYYSRKIAKASRWNRK